MTEIFTYPYHPMLVGLMTLSIFGLRVGVRKNQNKFVELKKKI